MKQLTKCVMHEELVRLKDSYVAEVNEIAYDEATGKRKNNKHKVSLCKQCAIKIGYKKRKPKKRG
jgi:hypothetical protein